MTKPLHKRPLKPLTTALARAITTGDAARIHAAAIALAHPASFQGVAGWPGLRAAGDALAALAAWDDASPFAALDAALCFRAGVADDEEARAAALATDTPPDGPPPAERCARWALAGRWADLAALPAPDGDVAEGPFGVATGAVARAAWRRARREALPLNVADAASAAQAEQDAWAAVTRMLRPTFDSLEACRANMLWLPLVGQGRDPHLDGAACTRLQRAGWRFWTASGAPHAPDQPATVHDLRGARDAAPACVVAQAATARGGTARWWGVQAARGLATWERGGQLFAAMLRDAHEVQEASARCARHGWTLRADVEERAWVAERPGVTVRGASLPDLVAQVRRSMAAHAEAPDAAA